MWGFYTTKNHCNPVGSIAVLTCGWLSPYFWVFHFLCKFVLGKYTEGYGLQGHNFGCVLSKGMQLLGTLWGASVALYLSFVVLVHFLSSCPSAVCNLLEPGVCGFSTCQQKCFSSSRPRSVYSERWTGKCLSVDFLLTTPSLRCQLIYFLIHLMCTMLIFSQLISSNKSSAL